MKNLYLLLFSMILLCTACSKEETNFAGTFTGSVLCSGTSEEEMSSLVIILNTDETYTMTIDQDVSFIGTANDNILTIANQTPLNAEFEPFLEATFTENEDGSFTLIASVDDDGEAYNCMGEFTRQ